MNSGNFTKLLRVVCTCVLSNAIHTISCHHSALNTRSASGFDIEAKGKFCKNSLQKLAWQHVGAVSQLARAAAHSSCQRNMQCATWSLQHNATSTAIIALDVEKDEKHWFSFCLPPTVKNEDRLWKREWERERGRVGRVRREGLATLAVRIGNAKVV